MTYGAKWFVRAEAHERRKEAAEEAAKSSGQQQDIEAEAIEEDEELTRKQLRQLFRDLPGHSSLHFSFLLHRQGQLEPKLKEPLTEEKFAELWRSERFRLQNTRRREISLRGRRKWNYNKNNEGYSEPYESYEAEVEEFGDEWRLKSIVEDCKKAEYYQQIHRRGQIDIPEREHLAQRTDRMADVAASALRVHYLEQNRPVLTHELADYENPYMMKQSAMERLFQERCVSSQLEERVMPRVLETLPDLVKLRAEAQLPPEVLEPLAAFRGDVRWDFEPRKRLAQKLKASEGALEAVAQSASAEAVVEGLPENAEVSASQVAPNVHHPWKNHVGFESNVPRGMAGGTKFGQPPTSLESQLHRLRYPTLQRVAHTLPADPKYRAHIVRTIRVLERSKHWDFASKLSAVNRLKEVYEYMRPSQEYTEDLDKKLPVNRIASHLKKRYSPDTIDVKSFPRKWRKRKSFGPGWYRPSLTATAPDPLRTRNKT